MERAPLRPVPRRPEGPVDPGKAHAHVAERLPSLDPAATTALALVEVAGRPRAAAAEHAGVSPDELADALARARKELRRSAHPLRGSGWCERAERSISDRLDDALDPTARGRLEVHLRNCPRCVEHERRLAQATEALLREFIERHAEYAPAPSGGQAALSAPAPELTVVPAAPEGPTVGDEGDGPPVPAPIRARLLTLAWYGLLALAVALAVAAVALAVIAAAGGL